MDYAHLENFNPAKLWDRLENNGECLEWQGWRDHKGYGGIRVGGRPGSLFRTHRVAYILTYGDIPDGLHVDHTCHNRACCNPQHLRLVTNKQNIENRAGANTNSKSGVRGVYWHKQLGRWHVQIGHNRQKHSGGTCADLEDAKAAAVELRNSFFTHNDVDRAAA